MSADWPHLTGFAAYWEKNANFAATFDRWLLNLFPREKPFVFSRGGCQTLNFIPSVATMIFGLLAGFVAIIEGCRPKRWAFPFVVVGPNPITLYGMWQLSSGFVRTNIKRHLGPDIFARSGATYTPILERLSVLLVFWLILFWMYRRKVFLRI